MPKKSAPASWKKRLSGALRHHELLKRTRKRGAEAPGHLACLYYLRRLESEHALVRSLLNDAWAEFDQSREYRKFQVHADKAQQRLHRAIKKLNKKLKKR